MVYPAAKVAGFLKRNKMRYDEIAALCMAAAKVKWKIEGIESLDISSPIGLWELQKKLDSLNDQLEIIEQAIKNEVNQ